MSYSDAEIRAFRKIAAGDTGSGRKASDIMKQMREGDRADLQHKVRVGRLTQSQAEAIFGGPL
jgi:hypothetical protein